MAKLSDDETVLLTQECVINGVTKTAMTSHRLLGQS